MSSRPAGAASEQAARCRRKGSTDSAAGGWRTQRPGSGIGGAAGVWGTREAGPPRPIVWMKISAGLGRQRRARCRLDGITDSAGSGWPSRRPGPEQLTSVGTGGAPEMRKRAGANLPRRPAAARAGTGADRLRPAWCRQIRPADSMADSRSPTAGGGQPSAWADFPTRRERREPGLGAFPAQETLKRAGPSAGSAMPAWRDNRLRGR